MVKWDSRSESDWRIFLNSEVALTELVDDGSFLKTPRSVMTAFRNMKIERLTMQRETLVD